jgi:hypothetical protein
MTDLYDRLTIFKILLNAIRFYHGCEIGLLFPQRKSLKIKRGSDDVLATDINLRRDEETEETFEQFDDTNKKKKNPIFLNDHNFKKFINRKVD